MGGKKLFNRYELIALIISLAVLAVLLMPHGDNSHDVIAHVTVRGDAVLSVPLNGDTTRKIDLDELYGVPALLEIDGRRIRFVNAICPDKICVNTGWIHLPGQSAVCLPNRTAVVLVA